MAFKIKFLFIVPFILLICAKSQAQTDSSVTYNIAVLAPLYLDSAFTGYTSNIKDNAIPKYIMAGLDFYNGVMLAVDSLQKEGVNVKVYVYDTKKAGESIGNIVGNMKYLNFSLIIASFNNVIEQSTVSAFSFDNNIPLISATYPNDANVNANPFFVMLNSSLKTHSEGIYKYLQKNYNTSKLLFITKKGLLEDKIKAGFNKMDSLPNKLKYRYLELTDDFPPSTLLSWLDSTRQNAIVCGSFNPAFAVKLVQTISATKAYKTTVIGMPNWDGIKDFSTDASSGVDIIYSTPFNYLRTDNKALINVTSSYKAKFFARPSDMVFKGFETMYHFTHLLVLHHSDLINNLSDHAFAVANDFYIQPVKIDLHSFVPDYQENKTLYFVKKLDGKLVSVSAPLN